MGNHADDNINAVNKIVPIEENESTQPTEVAEVLCHSCRDGILPDPARPNNQSTF
jgi:hypothetical protein